MPGLAHFCEHLLFMGTEKYPDENHFENHVRRFGGVVGAKKRGKDDKTKLRQKNRLFPAS